MLFEVIEDRRGGWVVLTFVGELDLGAIPRVRHAILRALNEAASEPGGPQVVLDLGAVDLIDSSGLGVVVGALRRVRTAGGSLAVVVGARVRDVFALTGLDRIMPVGATLDEAVVAADEERVAREATVAEGRSDG